jgi:hypothetical protein
MTHSWFFCGKQSTAVHVWNGKFTKKDNKTNATRSPTWTFFCVWQDPCQVLR